MKKLETGNNIYSNIEYTLLCVLKKENLIFVTIIT